MNKRYILVLIVTLLFITACSNQEPLINNNFSIIGDVSNSFNFQSLEGEFEAVTIEYNSKKIPAYKVSDLINKASPITGDFDLILVSDDYFSVRVVGDSLNDAYLVYDKEDNWVFLSEKHPKNSKVKNIKELIIINNQEELDKGLNVVSEDETFNYSIGNLYAKGYTLVPFIDGQTSKTVDGNEYKIEVMKYRKMIPLENILEDNAKVETILLASFEGEYEYLYNKDLFVTLEDNILGIYDSNRDLLYENVVGIMLNPPEMSNLEIYDMVVKYLAEDEKVLVILVDGFSYFQYQEYVVNNKELFLSSIEDVYKSTSVYKPVTNAGFSTIITGEKPSVHGVLDRSYRQVMSKTIFDHAKENDKSSILTEGDINILNIDVETVLNLDKNKDGFNEDEIFESSMENLDKDLLFVHFHSVDDAGHSYGPISEEVFARIEIVDEYIKQLVKEWSGKVLIVSDHGMHETVEGGSHGQFRAEDIFVPILVIDGEK
ncbi:MAG: alkaline phosphatase family protein [Clostridia bacterium]